jgi:hypothetical protein
VFDDHRRRLFAGEWLAEIETLGQITFASSQSLKLIDRFDALGDRLIP